jgi:protein SCO1/2
MGRWSTAASALAFAWALLSATAAAQVSPDAPPGLENVGVEEHLDRRIPTDVTFRDHTGERVRLGELLRGDRPVLLNLVYHTCPSFCSLVLDGTVAALAEQPWTVGEEFDVVTISIDPRDTPEVAADKRRRILYQYGRESAERGWHFLVAERSVDEDEIVAEYGVYPSIERLADALGFHYQWMPRQRQYAHPGVVMMLTPDGRIARYLYGLEYDSNDVRLGLLEASEGRSVSGVEQVILYCYRYDPSAQGYTLVAWRVMQIGGAITALLVFGLLLFFWRRETRKKREARGHEAHDSGLHREAHARG